MSAKRKLAMSGVAILVVLTLVAGATMAWFTDTEKVNADFKAGILDISVSDDDAFDGTELNFENMRPMTEVTAIAEMKATLNGTQDYEGYNPDPVYVQQFAISNDGTLPVNVKLSFEEVDPPAGDNVPKLVPNGNGGIKNVGEWKCNNELGKAYNGYTGSNSNATWAAENYSGYNPHFHVVLLQKDAAAEGGWTPVNSDISLETLLNVEGFELSDIIPAGATAENNTYALGAYLDQDAGNEYQGKEYHVNFTVNAKQVDEGAKYADEA
ncbi:MAG: SipW-dependent-type signal peptide-containing protein [Clostridium sp.]|nr:SipW-dependent-type signal peptide-containing protein [Clostridium sp.]